MDILIMTSRWRHCSAVETIKENGHSHLAAVWTPERNWGFRLYPIYLRVLQMLYTKMGLHLITYIFSNGTTWHKCVPI